MERKHRRILKSRMNKIGSCSNVSVLPSMLHLVGYPYVVQRCATVGEPCKTNCFCQQDKPHSLFLKCKE